ncbi:hypothetical protein ACET3Z_012840 [Daucus carota]
MNIEVLEKKLYNACLKGDVDKLEELIREDELILARVSISSCFDQTVLHVASMLGHFKFAESLLSYKPDFASRLDSQGHSPLHLASANGYANIVILLLEYDPKMCLVLDEDGRTPLQLAVMNGQHEAVSELIKVKSELREQELGKVLQLCVLYNRLNVLVLILESTSQHLSNSRYDKGKTILQLATSLTRTQIVKYLEGKLVKQSALYAFIGKMKLLNTILLDSNQLTGRIPNTFSNLSSLLDLDLNGGNHFTGKLPAAICRATSLETLDLSNNRLSGALPRCLGNFVDNQVQVTIATAFPKRCDLTTLQLFGNHFIGPLPQALANCKQLKILDIGKNKLGGSFPSWLMLLPALEVLILQENRLVGTISGSTAPARPFPKLQIVDLSANEITGYLPLQYFKLRRAIGHQTRHPLSVHKHEIPSYYEAYASNELKRRESSELQRLSYSFAPFTAIDLSCNKFYGEIPKETGEFISLQELNLSHNSLTGRIPSLLGNMAGLEALDLSSNQLTGAIPQQLTQLFNLAFLNLSNNHLTGKIPQRGQFSTFDNDSYKDNYALCGFPVTNKCVQEVSLPPEVRNADEPEENDGGGGNDEVNWEVILMGFGIGLICGLSTGYLVLRVGKPWWLVRYIEVLQQKLMKRFTRNGVINFTG